MYMVYQIECSPIDKSDYITEATFFDSAFLKSVADYVTQDIDTDNEAENLFAQTEKHGGKCNRTEKSLSFPAEYSRSYFKERFYRFKELVKDMCSIDLQLFCHNKILSSKIREVSSCFNNRDEDYVYSDGEIETFDEFVRSISPGETYYLGGIVAYK